MSEWADRNRVLSREYSSLPGPWRTDRAPYLREVQDAFRERWVERLTLCFGTQLGKTEALFNILGFAIDQDPGPVILAYPTDTLGKAVAKGRLRAAVDNCAPLAAKLNAEASEIMNLFFTGVEVAVVGGNSPSQLASRPARYVFFDETDKFPLRAGNDANPFLLAGERTKTFHNKKEVEASSPTFDDGHIWQSWLRADARKRYFVPCPHCGEMQTLNLAGIQWPEDLNHEAMPRDERLERVQQEAWYACASCRGRIYDLDKQGMLARGEWRCVDLDANREHWVACAPPTRPRKVAYNISSIYSPWIRFGEVARKFLEVKDKPEEFMGFVNGWLAEPWVNQAAKLLGDAVLARRCAHERGNAPQEALLLTAGIDVQENEMWWTIRAWGEEMTSWLVDYGRCETWAKLDEVLDREYGGMLVHLAFCDSGHRTDEVYQYCASRPGLVFPCKGSSQRMPKAPYQESQIDKSGIGTLRLFIIDTHFYKNFIAGRLTRPKGEPGSWNVFAGCHREYADQICSEHLVTEQNRQGRTHELWKPITEHIANHLLDAEVYATAAAERAGVRYLRREVDEPEAPRDKSEGEARKPWVRR